MTLNAETRKKARGAKVKSKAEHFSKHHVVTPAATVTIYVAQDSKGLYYASPAIQWENPDEKLRNLATDLTPSVRTKFDDQKDAAWSAIIVARDHLERLLLDRLTDEQLAAIRVVDDALVAEVLSRPQPSAQLDLAEELPAIEWEEAKVECDLISRHPQNREIPIPSVADLAESIRKTGRVLERVKLRDLGDGRYQMISGERRWKAVHLVLGWPTIDADVATMSDAAARALLTICNTQRQDLNDIEKATDLQQLCMRTDQGGAGMTQEAAGQLYGMSQSHAANLIRVLGAPESLRRLIIAGEIPSSFVRAALPYMPVSGIEKAIAKEVASWHRNRDEAGQDMVDRVPTRKDFSAWLKRETGIRTCSMEPAVMDWYSEGTAKFERDRLFEPTAEQLSQLRLITVDGWNGKVEVATNKKLWDRLQKAAIPEAVKKWREKKTTKADKSSKGTGKASGTRSAGEQKLLDQQRAKQLAERVRVWRHGWLKGMIAERLDEDPLILQKLRTWSTRVRLHDVQYDSREHAWRSIAELSEGDLEQYDLAHARALIVDDEKNPKWPRLTWEHVDDLARMAGIDVAAEWAAMQRSAAKPVEFETFFLLHDKGRLERLAAELKVNIHGLSTKKQLVARLIGQPRALPLPKAIGTLTAAKKPRGKK